MNAVTNQLTNRDIALLAWLAIFAIFLLLNRDLRNSLKPLLHILFVSKITIFLLVLMAYIAFVVTVGYKLGAWQLWMLKDTLYWFLGSALITFFSINQASRDDYYFKRVVLQNLRFAVVLDFVINLYVFHLVVELLLLPALATLAMLVAVADSKREFAQAKTMLEWVTALVGLFILVHAAIAVFSDPESLATVNNLKDFVLPLVLTFLLLPLIYVLALYSSLEDLHVHLKVSGRDEMLARFATWQIVKACRLRLSEVRRFSDSFAANIRSAETRAEIVAVINEFKAKAHVRKP